jgi:hypothetical protein
MTAADEKKRADKVREPRIIKLKKDWDDKYEYWETEVCRAVNPDSDWLGIFPTYIEYAAYQAVCAERDELSKKVNLIAAVAYKHSEGNLEIFDKLKAERDALVAKLERAKEALEFYAGFSDEPRIFDNVSLMAREVLKEIGE